MHFAAGDMRDHITTDKNDHQPSYGRCRAERQRCVRIKFREIFGDVRFSTFSTISAMSRHRNRASGQRSLGRHVDGESSADIFRRSVA
jgi:hypothetical protein